MKPLGSPAPFGGPREMVPGYVRLGLDEVRRRARRAVEALEACRFCPRECGVNRLADRWSACKTGRFAVVASAFPHMGEEACLRGRRGSGTIFFGHCNLRCVFCQNHDISQGLDAGPPRENIRAPADPPGIERLQSGAGGKGSDTGSGRGTRGVSARALADLMLRLQNLGCHNINLVTPEHVVPQFLEGLALAAEDGLRLPIVYNTSAYDAPASLQLLDGIVDIYMPDLKLLDPDLSRRYLKAGDYPGVAREALREMNRQVGPLRIGEDGLARQGVLVRHLVLPGHGNVTREILDWIFREMGPDTFVNVMGQYRPAGSVGPEAHPELNRPLLQAEYDAAVEYARTNGLSRAGPH